MHDQLIKTAAKLKETEKKLKEAREIIEGLEDYISTLVRPDGALRD